MNGVGLAQAIEMLRRDIAAAQQAAQESGIQFPVQSLTVELKVALSRQADGKLGFQVPFFGTEVGASAGLHQETTQTVTLVLGPPVDGQGRPCLVSQVTDRIKG